MKLHRTWPLLVSAVALTVACSSKEDTSGKFDDFEPGGSGGATGGFDGGQGGDIISTTGGTSGGGAGTGSGSTPGAGGGTLCEGQDFAAEPMPVDMFLMYDQSQSMTDPVGGSTRWDAARAAMSAFLNDSKASGVGVGIQFFPLGGVAPGSCTAPYSTADVPITLLPGAAQGIVDAINRKGPSAFTPTGPALEGAISHMKAWAPAHPGRAPVVVLVTDGFPTECEPRQMADIAAMAKSAFETDPPVRTYVVGFGDGLGNLSQIAKAGGGEVFLMDEGADVAAQFVNAMLSIASTPLQCEFDIPKIDSSTEEINPGLVQVTYTPNATKVREEVPKLNQLGDCLLNSGKGWYYDDIQKPTKIYVCDGTCDAFRAGIVSIGYGCSPIPGVVQ